MMLGPYLLALFQQQIHESVQFLIGRGLAGAKVLSRPDNSVNNVLHKRDDRTRLLHMHGECDPSHTKGSTLNTLSTAAASLRAAREPVQQ